MNTDAIAVLSCDPALAPVIQAWGPYEIPAQPFECLFDPLARSIVFQQLSGKAAGTIHGRFIGAFGDGDRADPERVAAANPDELRAVGLSRRKVEYVQELARASRSGALPAWADLQEMADEVIVERLVAFRGVGRWTVEMLLMFWLARPDVFPTSDLGIRKGIMLIDELDEMPEAATMRDRAEIWRPHRSLASWYLWRATEDRP